MIHAFTASLEPLARGSLNIALTLRNSSLPDDNYSTGTLMKPSAARRSLMTFKNAVNDFHVAGREIHWHSRGRFSDAGFSGAALEKVLGAEATLRNSSTLRKLMMKCAGR